LGVLDPLIQKSHFTVGGKASSSTYSVIGRIDENNTAEHCLALGVLEDKSIPSNATKDW